MAETPQVRALAYIGVMQLGSFVDMGSINKGVDLHIENLCKRINVTDLGSWKLLVKLVYNSGTHIGIGKRVISYPSDNEKEWALGIPIPDKTQAIYGLSEKHFVHPGRSTEGKYFHLLDPEFQNYTNLQTYTERSISRG